MANEISLDVACKIYGISTRRYRQLAKEDKVPEPKGGVIDFGAATKAVVEYYRKLAEGQGSLSLTDERTRLTRIQADRKQLELEKARGNLIEVDTAMNLWGMVVMNIRSKLLAIPTKLAPLVFNAESIPAVQQRAEKFIHEVMTELANPNFRDIARVGGNKRGPRDDKAPARTQHKRMGRRKKAAKS